MEEAEGLRLHLSSKGSTGYRGVSYVPAQVSLIVTLTLTLTPTLALADRGSGSAEAAALGVGRTEWVAMQALRGF